MMYEVTLWRNSDYCDVAPHDIEACTWKVNTEAENKYIAGNNVLRKFIFLKSKHSDPTDYPKIYEIKQLETNQD